MSDVPEYSYRSADVLYEVYLPKWATREDSLDLVVVNPDDKDDKIRVRIEDQEAEPTTQGLKKRAADWQSWIDNQSSELWTGEILGRDAVRRTTRGSVSWTKATKAKAAVSDVICIGITQADGKHACGSLFTLAEAGTAAADRDLWDVASRIRMGSPLPIPDETSTFQVRHFGISAPETRNVAFRGLLGEQDHGPLQPSLWDGDVQARGFKMKWRISGPIRDVAADIRASKEQYGIPALGHGNADKRPLQHSGLPIIDYLVSDRPAVEYPKVESTDPQGNDVLVDSSRNRAAFRTASAWLAVGRSHGAKVTLRVEVEALDRWEQWWGDLMNSVRVEQG